MLYEQSCKQVEDQLDITYILKQMRKVDKLAELLLSEGQIQLLDYFDIRRNERSMRKNIESLFENKKQPYEKQIDCKILAYLLPVDLQQRVLSRQKDDISQSQVLDQSQIQITNQSHTYSKAHINEDEIYKDFNSVPRERLFNPKTGILVPPPLPFSPRNQPSISRDRNARRISVNDYFK
ncbi:hypothetical protein FGO68_gene5057 [Halteria grandinella]|uniref:Uncharacterized protein n=1 Tax=Halteria grandinella TaxID=5974 RepID=A0A8J8T4E2_HALGN|nr:hypothetical protein FGO68_gene5057 [Halteria grandinella]